VNIIHISLRDFGLYQQKNIAFFFLKNLSELKKQKTTFLTWIYRKNNLFLVCFCWNSK